METHIERLPGRYDWQRENGLYEKKSQRVLHITISMERLYTERKGD